MTRKKTVALEKGKMRTKTIHQSATFKANPHEVYEMLMDSRKHAQFTGAKASISRRIGGKISAYDGYIEGTNLSLVPNKKIVQLWRGNDWPTTHYSKATFSLKKVKTGTRLSFTQSMVPARSYTSISQGWREYYWVPMKRTLEKTRVRH